MAPDPTRRAAATVHTQTAATVERSLMTALVRPCGRKTGQTFGDAASSHPFAVREYRTLWSLWRAFSVYRPRPSCACVTFFRASVRPLDYRYRVPTSARAAQGNLVVCDVPGDHFSTIRELHVSALARAMAAHIDGSVSSAGSGA